MDSNGFRYVSELIQLFSDEHPLFKRAKTKGRPVGYLFLDEIEDYIDVDSILDFGVKKFPRLSLVEFSFQGKPRLLAKSSKIPIVEIMENYADLGLNA